MFSTSSHSAAITQVLNMSMFVISMCLIGCGDSGPQLVPLQGTVRLGAEPVTAGSIYLHPDAANSFQGDTPGSLLGLDGSFSMKTFPYGDGVPPGKYKITLSPDLAARLKVPEYSNPMTTPWQIDVGNEGNASLLLDVILPAAEK